MRKRKALYSISAILLALAVLFSACSNDAVVLSSSESIPSSAGQSDTAPSQDISEGKKAEELTIAGLVHVENQWGAMLIAGMQAACDEYGAKFVSANFNGDPAREAELVNTYIAQKVDGICTSPMQASISVYKEAVAQGIPVSGVTLRTDDSSIFSAYYLYDNWDLGMAAAEYAVEFIKENLDSKPVWHGIYLESGHNTTLRVDAFQKVMTENFGEEYGAPVSTSTTRREEEAMQQVSDALTANPNINIIMAGCETSFLGAMSTIQNMGLQDKVFCFAVDCSEQMAELILDENNSILQAVGAQNSYQLGYLACKDLIDTLLGTRTDFVMGEPQFMEVPKLNKGNLNEVKEYLEMLKGFSGNK